MTKALELLTIEELEKAKKKAIEQWNGLRYVEVCDALGLEPDVLELYSKGMAEIINIIKARDNSLEYKTETKSHPNYSGFVDETNKLNINTRSFTRDTDRKRELLEKYFPRKFGLIAKRLLSNYDDAKAGYIFNILLEQAKKYSGQ